LSGMGGAPLSGKGEAVRMPPGNVKTRRPPGPRAELTHVNDWCRRSS